MAAGDIDGDGLVDVVVTDPSAAQLLVFRQHKRQGLDSGTTYPALVGSTQVRIAQVGKGPASVIVLSPREKTMGVAKFEDGRLTFPTSMPLPIEPLAFEVTDLDGDNTPEVLYLGEERDKDRSDEYQLAALKWTEKGWEDLEPGQRQNDQDGPEQRARTPQTPRRQPGRPARFSRVLRRRPHAGVIADRQSRRPATDQNARRHSVRRRVPRIGIH